MKYGRQTKKCYERGKKEQKGGGGDGKKERMSLLIVGSMDFT